MYKNSSNFMELQKNNQLTEMNKNRPHSIDQSKDIIKRNTLASLSGKPNQQMVDEDSNAPKQLGSDLKKQMPKTQTQFEKYSQAHSQPRQPMQSRDLQTQPHSIKNDPNTNNRDEYQSTLLTRFLKEPRLPPSTNIINKRKSYGAPVKTAYRLNQTTDNQLGNNNQASGSKVNNGQKKNLKQPVISYRNQSEIMKKIFGNEQNYNQVKNLVKGQPDEKYQSNSRDEYQGQGQVTNNAFRAQSTPHQEKNQMLQTQNDKKMQQISSPQQAYYQNQQESIFTNKPILAKSKEKLEESRDINKQFADIKSPNIGVGSDQVEKAIFDLQDVKNNYFQEKSLYDKKIQQIQIKQQNTTYGNGFFQNPNLPIKTHSSTFFNGSGRPMTQGSAFFKNQSLMNDDNILKGDLDQVSKEDLKERLVVAEMVMKKLFQRNRDLEDMVYNSNQKKDNKSPNHHQLQSSQEQSSAKLQNQSLLNDESFFKDSDMKLGNQNDILTDLNCQSCIELRKELTQKESEYQKKINDLQLQLLNKADNSDSDSHLRYLRVRIEETMNEAKRHFSNYIQLRNTYNGFLESRLNLNQIVGGTKGQKLQGDILNMLKKNLEHQDHVLQEEQQQLKKSLAKIETIVDKRESTITQKDKKIKQLNEEIERRQFLEAKVQKYVKGMITQNQRCVNFIQQMKENLPNQMKIDEFLRQIQNKDYDENEGESTENEVDDDHEDEYEQSVEINDL